MVVPSGDQAAVRASRSGSPTWTAPVNPSAAATKMRDEQNDPSAPRVHVFGAVLSMVAEKAGLEPLGDQSAPGQPVIPTTPEATVSGREPSASTTMRSQAPGPVAAQ